MTEPRIGPNSPERLQRLEQKIQSHALTLVTRHLPDLAYAKSKFSAAYDKPGFVASHAGSTPQARDPANAVTAAWDAAMNDPNEVLPNAYGLVHGYSKIGPHMPVVYAEAALALTQASQLTAINKDRNLLTHGYPFAVAGDLYDAIEAFERVVKPTLEETRDFALAYGVAIPAVP